MTSESSLFRRFEANLRMSPETVKKVQDRYHTITRRLNQDFWGSDSDIDHSWYAGSYGRGTAISTSDIDIHFEIPVRRWFTYVLADLQPQCNGASMLLQAVKESLQKTYPTTKLRGDGQVVVVEFSDGITFEVVPVAKKDDETYWYPDTHDGGSWPQMRPKLEAGVFADLSREKPGGLKKFCRMLRAWNLEHDFGLQGQAIDAMAFGYWNQSPYAEKAPFLYFDWHTRDFFTYWVNRFRQGGYVEAPGSRRAINVPMDQNKLSWFNVFARASEAAASADSAEAAEIWRLIYGAKFPTE